MGYMRQRGDLVMGGEIAFATAPDASYDDPTLGAEVDGAIFDFKYRVGYAGDKFLPYAILGTSIIPIAGENVVDLAGVGLSAGLGVDYMISDSFIVGAEYLARFTSGVAEDTFFGTEYDFDLRLDSVTVRAAYKF